MKVVESAHYCPIGHTKRIYFLGDCHIGKTNCAEKAFQKIVKMIADDPDALWIGGGDYIDSIKPSDTKRFSLTGLPNWMIEHRDASDIRGDLADIVMAQADRFLKFIEPIKGKCLGLIEGNHEGSIQKYHNQNIMGYLCDEVGAPHLTDCAIVSLQFSRSKKATSTKRFNIWVEHGFGGGRTAGAEPIKLAAMLAKVEGVHFAARGHSHTFHVLPPQPRIGLVTSSQAAPRATQSSSQAANWGAYVLSYSEGPSTYDSRASYPVRALTTFCVEIKPFYGDGAAKMDYTVKQINLEV